MFQEAEKGTEKRIRKQTSFNKNGRIRLVFDQYDYNHDGRVSVDEISRLPKAGFMAISGRNSLTFQRNSYLVF